MTTEHLTAAQEGREMSASNLTWFMPRLEYAFDMAGKNLTTQMTREEFNADLFGSALSGTDLWKVLFNGESIGLLTSVGGRRGRTYQFTELMRLLSLHNAEAAEEAMPLFLAAHERTFAFVYEKGWCERNLPELTMGFATKRVPDAPNRAAAFHSQLPVAKAARSQDVARFMELWTFPSYTPHKQGHRRARDVEKDTPSQRPQATTTDAPIPPVAPPERVMPVLSVRAGDMNPIDLAAIQHLRQRATEFQAILDMLLARQPR
jgi:hypothetical protein